MKSDKELFKLFSAYPELLFEAAALKQMINIEWFQ